MSPHLALHFLGAPQLYLDNAPIPVGRRKAVALLAYLAIERGQHRRESLSALLWPDYEQSKAFTNLRHTLWETQQSIGEDWLMTDREQIGLNHAADIWLDVQQFGSLLAQARAQNDISLRIPLLVESTKLYRDHFLTGFSLKDAPSFNEWAFAESGELRCQLAGALISLSEDYCALGQAEQAIPHARRLITLDPLNESAHRRLMQVYAEAGQHSAALKQYQLCEEILRKELNLDPQPETYALYKQIRKGEAKPAQLETREEMIAPKHDLPLQRSTLIGREKEQEKLEIRNKTEHDPVADLYVPDAWIRWALLAAEDIIGKLGVKVILRKAGLEHLIDNYPSDEQPKPSRNFTFGDYTALNAGLLDFCGREGESKVLSIGHTLVHHSVMELGALDGIGAAALPRFLSFPAKLEMCMEILQESARKASLSIGQNRRIFIEDRGNKLAYVAEDCDFCAGKLSDKPMCMLFTGVFQECAHWLTGATFHIEEVECRAMGAKACVWESNKQPQEHRSD